MFAVDGIISLNSDIIIDNPYITVDGSTAPGKGITIKDGTIIISTNDVIMRYLKVRPGDEVVLKKGIWKDQKRKTSPKDAITVGFAKDVILDHISASWTSDEVISVMDSKNVTVQWSIITEPLANPKLHIEYGEEIAHAYGSLMSGENISYIKNIYSNFKFRGPQMVGTEGKKIPIQLFTANNIVAFYSDSGTRAKIYSDQNVKYIITNNIYLAPLNSKAHTIQIMYGNSGKVDKKSKIYIDNNILPNKLKQRDNDWSGVDLKDIDSKDAQSIKSTNIPFDYPRYLNLLPPERVIDDLLPSIGASRPYRDKIDTRILNQIKTGTGGGIVEGQDSVGGYEQ